MPIRLGAPVLTVDAGKMHKVDTRNVENLFGMWTVFSRCANSIEEGRRLENLSWRLWNRETFCCESQPQFNTTPAIDIRLLRPGSKDIPELSVSVDSVASEFSERIERRHSSNVSPLDIRRPSSRTSSIETRVGSRGREKHITSLGLEKMVMSIKETKSLKPLSPRISEAVPTFFPSANITPRPATPVRHSPRHSDSSSTAPLSSPESTFGVTQTCGSETSVELIGSHSVVRGFSPSHISSSYRSHTQLAPTPLPTKFNKQPTSEELKKKGGLFMLGTSSGEDDSSFEEQMSHKPSIQSSLTAGLKNPLTEKKQTSFRDEVESRIINHTSHEDEDVFETDDEGDPSEEAVVEDDDEDDWEEEDSIDSAASSVNEKSLFQRVDSKPHLISRRSLLTTMMHQPDRATAFAEAAAKNSKSTPNFQRSRTTSPNGPSVAASPEEDSVLEMQGSKFTRSKPIIMTTSNLHPPALSPRTTRRNMLATELTESLRKHLLWERQQKNTTANAVLKRRHTAHDMANLQQFPSAPGSGTTSKNNSWNHYFDHGLGEYHQKGW